MKVEGSRLQMNVKVLELWKPLLKHFEDERYFHDFEDLPSTWDMVGLASK